MSSGALRPVAGLALASTLLLAVACGEGSGAEYSASQSNGFEPVSVEIPILSDTALLGESLFNTNCSECHGVNAAGSPEGPPLIDRIYEPSHHADFSFHLAVRQGVRQHHWQFGDMDPVDGVSTDDVYKLVCYVRELQHANGIFEDSAGLTTCQSN